MAGQVITVKHLRNIMDCPHWRIEKVIIRRFKGVRAAVDATYFRNHISKIKMRTYNKKEQRCYRNKQFALIDGYLFYRFV